MKDIQTLLSTFSLKAHDITLYELAFTHSSCNNEAKTKHHDYERLEFLGDAVIECIISELAYKVRPDMDQGLLTKLRSFLVKTKSLSSYALKYHFDEYIRIGNSFDKNIKEVPSVLEDVFEAFIGACFLDLGFVKTRKLIISIFYRDIQTFSMEKSDDYKSKLQELLQSIGKNKISYRVIKETGSSNNKTFEVEVLYDQIVYGKGTGLSKKEAEQMAAKNALEKRAI